MAGSMIVIAAALAFVAFVVGRQWPALRQQVDSAIGPEGGRLFWRLAKIALAVLVVALLAVNGPPQLMVVLGVAALVIWWYREFAGLMDMGEEVFPSRIDKLIWAIFLIVLPPVGTPVFWYYRQSRWSEAKRASAAQADWAA